MWENVGWHYCVYTSHINVHGYQHPMYLEPCYTCLISDTPGGGGGRTDWTRIGRVHKDPVACVREALQDMRDQVQRLEIARVLIDKECTL